MRYLIIVWINKILEQMQTKKKGIKSDFITKSLCLKLWNKFKKVVDQVECLSDQVEKSSIINWTKNSWFNLILS